jgi:hypothetical protein
MNEEKSVAGLINYIKQFKPELIKEFRGADNLLINKFEQTAKKLTGFSLPPEYRDFLSHMGGGQTPIAFTYDASTELNEVLETYEIRIEDEEPLPTSCLLIATGGYQIEQVALECYQNERGETIGRRVFAASGEELRYVMADSFLNLLFRRAFESCASLHLPVTATYLGKTKEPTLPIIANLVEKFGWSKHWFSDSVTLSMTAPENNFVLYSEQPLNDYNWLRIAGKDQKQITLLGDQICRAADMEFEKWWS